jgi:hypothetical protein
MRKAFSHDLFGENDKKARDAARKLFGHKYLVLDNPYTYDPDLLLYFEDLSFAGFMEVEVKQFWDGWNFPDKFLHISERKSKFLDFENIVFCVFNRKLTRCAWILGKDLESVPLITKPNKYVNKGEQFFNIPVELLRFTKTSG